MKTLLALLLFVVSASAQLSPRVELTVTFATVKQANDARTALDAKALEVNIGKVASINTPSVVATNSAGKPELRSVTFYGGKAAMQIAKQFIQTNQWPAGTVISVKHHLCPGTNTPPTGWLGCFDDPRAESTEVTFKP